jgi:hypothetical protein
MKIAEFIQRTAVRKRCAGLIYKGEYLFWNPNEKRKLSIVKSDPYYSTCRDYPKKGKEDKGMAQGQ